MSKDDAKFKRLRAVIARAVNKHCPQWLRADVEDIVQTALLKLYRMIEKDPDFDPGDSYAFRVGYTAVIDLTRKRQKERPLPAADDEVPVEPEDDGPGPHQLAEARELDERMRQCLRLQTNEKRKRAYTLHSAGCDAARVAKIMSINKKSAENFISLGKKDLRECLEKHGWVFESRRSKKK